MSVALDMAALTKRELLLLALEVNLPGKYKKYSKKRLIKELLPYFVPEPQPTTYEGNPECSVRIQRIRDAQAKGQEL